jgi:hypothetical protein
MERTVPKAKTVVTANLEAGMPHVHDALLHLESELDAARRRGVPLLRLIHGYGSKGVSGRIRRHVRARLAELLEQRVIRGVVYGEDLSEVDVAAQAFLTRHPALRSTLRTDRLNAGITFVEL